MAGNYQWVTILFTFYHRQRNLKDLVPLNDIRSFAAKGVYQAKLSEYIKKNYVAQIQINKRIEGAKTEAIKYAIINFFKNYKKAEVKDLEVWMEDHRVYNQSEAIKLIK